MRVTVPKNCTGFEHADGTRYNANRRGVVDIDNPKHAKDFRANKGSDIEGGLGAADVISAPRIGYNTCAGRSCECGFSLFKWQTVCPRCGRGDPAGGSGVGVGVSEAPTDPTGANTASVAAAPGPRVRRGRTQSGGTA